MVSTTVTVAVALFPHELAAVEQVAVTVAIGVDQVEVGHGWAAVAGVAEGV